MFMGEYQHNIDEKGRLIIPSKFREELGAGFVITRGLDNCLFVYPRKEWEILEAKLKSLPLTSADARAFVRFFFSGAGECELDKQGRILIPIPLRDYAKLVRDCVVIGVSNRVEIWAKEAWESYSNDAADSFAAIAEKLTDLTF
ncbi:division/cell wall cluster transcriptional repressor MraZ [Effusibacillus lacus]|uniref:Transcriptional regulator MraZ n=1 Tax=Effusibacillus lacus TaxID=1348429 RepID=A0A292YRA1_9BACL|nr:division/cell wall cluster transcriptional repressor MraZ [Effusibacillus lacus]TCS75695.1 MraZ protein [Effusibacillus lacus]GAX91015.1 division/cell wall cluster transcriptional repressor MraZ [Effusibacillus lacus]